MYTTERQVVAVDRSTGEIQWTVDRIGRGFWNDRQLVIDSPPILSNDHLLVRTRKSVLSLNPADGTVRWKHKTTSGYNDLLSVGNTLYVISDTGTGVSLVGIDRATGLERFRSPADSMMIPKAYSDNRIVGPLEEETFGGAKATTGEIVWRKNFTSQLDSRPVRKLVYPCISNGIVYGGTDRLFALDLNDGSTNWTYEFTEPEPTYHRIVSDGTTAYVIKPERDRVFALDATTGEQQRSTETKDLYGWHPVLTDETLYIPHGTGVFALDTATGAERFHLQPAGEWGHVLSLIIIDGILYARTVSGLVAFSDNGR